MSHTFKYLRCPVLVLRVAEAQVSGDTIADTLRDELLQVYEQSGAIHVIIDMGQVTYLSSAGLRPLLALNKHAHLREGRLVLCNLSSDVEGVFLATRLISTSGATPATFEKHRTVPEAVASLYA
jgi:anti-anti-sigma factor